MVVGQYSLTVKYQDPTKGPIAKHYRIRNLDDGGYYISTKITFTSLEKLVSHYLGGSFIANRISESKNND